MRSFHPTLLNPVCASQSVGTANQLFVSLVQTILAAQCSLSPSEKWPNDYGPTAIEYGEKKLNYKS